MDQLILGHISDPHFGNNPGSRQVEGWIGQKGHDWTLCRALYDALRHVQRSGDSDQNDPVYLVLSGDLTRTGSEDQGPSPTKWNEFQVGMNFLESLWPSLGESPAARIRLPDFVKTQPLLVIPGNHDHWRGSTSSQWSYTDLPPACIRPSPWKEELLSPQGGFKVVFYGVDSTRGLKEDREGNPVSKTNHRAQGRILTNDIEQIRIWLQESRSEEAQSPEVRYVRVLLCHHTLHTSSMLSWIPTIQRLHRDSRTAIREFARSSGLDVMLSGHTHDFLACANNVGDNFYLREYRSPTTLQGPAKPFAQGLWGHRISLEGQQLWWRSWPYFYQGRYFEPMNLQQILNHRQSKDPFSFVIERNPV